MIASQSRRGQLIAGVAGALLIVSLFLPWADTGGVSRNGWELWTMADVFFAIAAFFAITAAITGGRFGLFRPDLSVNGATDLLGVLATVLLAWLIIFDFPAGASREIGVYLALIAAMAIAGGAGDYRTLRGAPLFPRAPADDGRASPSRATKQ
jgi:hypothetical protein